MKCPDCQGELAVLRQCRRVRLKCGECGREFRIHELAVQLDEQTEKILARYTAIIYD